MITGINWHRGWQIHVRGFVSITTFTDSLIDSNLLYLSNMWKCHLSGTKFINDLFQPLVFSKDSYFYWNCYLIKQFL